MEVDENKTREQLIAELDAARARIAVLESREREREERYRSLVELSPEGIFVLRDGVILFCNTAGARLLGAEKPERIVGRRIEDFIPDEFREMAHAWIRGLDREETALVPFMEQSLVSLDGRRMPVETAATSFPFDGAQAQLVILRDVSERKRSEESLHVHSHLLDSVDQAVIALDPGGKIIFWNRFAGELYGWPREEALGRNGVEVLPANEWSASLFRGGEAGARATGEFLFRHREGAPFPVMVTNSPILDERGAFAGTVSISCDISERKRTEQELNRLRGHLAEMVEEKTAELQQANRQLEHEVIHRRRTEEALRASERKLRRILEESRDSMMLADERGMVVEWNPAAEEITGIPRARATLRASSAD
jgi:PAS domain S-box-containing protein